MNAVAIGIDLDAGCLGAAEGRLEERRRLEEANEGWVSVGNREAEACYALSTDAQSQSR